MRLSRKIREQRLDEIRDTLASLDLALWSSINGKCQPHYARAISLIDIVQKQLADLKAACLRMKPRD